MENQLRLIWLRNFGVSQSSVKVSAKTSQSYQSQVGTTNDRPYVSLISVSSGSLWRSHIWRPPVSEKFGILGMILVKVVQWNLTIGQLNFLNRNRIDYLYQICFVLCQVVYIDVKHESK